MDRLDIDDTWRPVSIIVLGDEFLDFPIYSGKHSKFQEWIVSLKKKNRIDDLTSAEIVNLADYYSHGTVSENIGLFLDENPEASWTDLLQQLTIKYAECVGAADAARELEQDRAREKCCPN